MAVARSVLLFVLAAFAEIGGCWLIWQGWRENQPDANFGRILAAYGGIFVASSLAWGMVVDKFRPDRWDIIGAAICLIGVAVIMYAPRATH